MHDTAWSQFAAESPALAATAAARFLATKHHVLATLRRGGAPRVSGTEVQFTGPHLSVGMMYGSMKARDLQRDGRFALHANPGDGSMQGGDVKLAGVAREVTDPDELGGYVDEIHPPEPFHLFHLGLQEVIVTTVHPDGDRLVIERWQPGTPVDRIERR